VKTIESLVEDGRVAEFAAGHTVYAEADTERLAIILHGLLRVYSKSWQAMRSPRSASASRAICSTLPHRAPQPPVASPPS
jgi:hypothetical protein